MFLRRDVTYEFLFVCLAALKLHTDPPVVLVRNLEYMIARSKFMKYLSDSAAFSKSLHDETATQKVDAVGAEFKLLSRSRSELEIELRPYADLLQLFDFDSKHVFTEYTSYMLTLASTSRTNSNPRPSEGQSSSNNEAYEKHLVFKELKK